MKKIQFRTFDASGNLQHESTLRWARKAGPLFRKGTWEVGPLRHGTFATLSEEHLDRYTPGWRTLIKKEEKP